MIKLTCFGFYYFVQRYGSKWVIYDSIIRTESSGSILRGTSIKIQEKPLTKFEIKVGFKIVYISKMFVYFQVLGEKGILLFNISDKKISKIA